MTRAGRLFTAVNWKYALGELALITAGVLIALALSAAWDNHQQQQRSRGNLQALARDLDETVIQLDTAIAIDSTTLVRTSRFIRLVHTDVGPEPSQDSIRIWSRFRYPRFEPATATVDQLLATGELSLIHDADLRGMIAAYAGMLRTSQQGLSIQEEMFHEVTNMVRERLEVHSVWRGIDSDSARVPRRVVSVDAMKKDPVLRAAFVNTRTMQSAHLVMVRRARAQAVALRDRIAVELGDTVGRR